MAYSYQDEQTQAIPDYHRAQMMAAARASQITSAGTTEGPGPLDRLMQSLSHLEDSTGMVVHMTDSLCGSQPTDSNAKNSGINEPAAAGHFAAISLSANRIDRMAQIIADCMNRIQRVAG